MTDESRGSQVNESSLRYLDIVGAKNLYIGTSNTVNRAAERSSTTQKIFKITDEGYIEEVKYLDENKNEISISQQPNGIFSVNENYILITFTSSSYLVRKKDGAVFDMAKVGFPETASQFINVSMIKTDRHNNLYFITIDYLDNTPFNKIVKVDLGGGDFLNATVISASTDSVSFFDVDWNGNVIYNGCLKSNNSNFVYRIRTANGRIKNLGEMAVYWVAPDGNIYFQSRNYDEYKKEEYNYETGETIYYGWPIKKITIDSSYNIEEIDVYGYITSNELGAEIEWGANYKIDIQNKVFIISPMRPSIFEVYNEESIPRLVTFDSLDIDTITAVSSTENYYYVSGIDSDRNTFLVQIDPNTDSVVNLLSQDEYVITAFTASETDGIVFNAERRIDSRKIIGKVGINGGDVSIIIDEESDVEITYLERIN